jgi:hypothetical protein
MRERVPVDRELWPTEHEVSKNTDGKKAQRSVGEADTETSGFALVGPGVDRARKYGEEYEPELDNGGWDHETSVPDGADNSRLGDRPNSFSTSPAPAAEGVTPAVGGADL